MKDDTVAHTRKFQPVLLIAIFLLAGCGRAQARPPAVATSLPVEPLPTETSSPSTATVPPPTDTPVPAPTQDPTVFGSIGTGEIQAYALEPVANAIFTKTMDGFVVARRIQEYQVTNVKIFPGSNGLLAEIIFNVRTTDPAWIAEGGTPEEHNWLNGMCYRFDFFTTETDYQLKNRRLCS
jgi:hypothetical protein